MSEKRFEVVLNEFDEVEYIMDKKLCEDKDFAEFMDFVEELAKENEQLKQEKDKYRVMINANASLNDEVYEQLKKTEKSYKECREENEQLRKSEKINMEYAEQIVEENHKLRIAKNDLRIENEQLKRELHMRKMSATIDLMSRR